MQLKVALTPHGLKSFLKNFNLFYLKFQIYFLLNMRRVIFFRVLAVKR